ncbi:hypothetical protein HKD37_14G040313 [Glycine soja]
MKIKRERDSKRNKPLSLTYSERVLQSEHKTSPMKPRFSHSREFNCSDDEPKHKLKANTSPSSSPRIESNRTSEPSQGTGLVTSFHGHDPHALSY